MSRSLLSHPRSGNHHIWGLRADFSGPILDYVGSILKAPESCQITRHLAEFSPRPPVRQVYNASQQARRMSYVGVLKIVPISLQVLGGPYLGQPPRSVKVVVCGKVRCMEKKRYTLTRNPKPISAHPLHVEGLNMVVSLNTGIPIQTPKYYSPCPHYRDPQQRYP